MSGGRLVYAGLVLGLLALLIGGPLAVLLSTGVAGRPAAMEYLLDVAVFTLLQATLSALLSAGLAVPAALALAMRPTFPGRPLLLRLFALPMALPVLVGVIGILGVYGQAGLVNRLLLAVGAGGFPSIYGLGGILLAHVFYNLPLATLLVLARLEETPSETWRIASSLGLKPWSVFRFIDLPALREALPRTLSLVFMLAVASFTIVLTLGGGPGATTLEVAIYQALRFDFDPALAARLAILQVAISGMLALMLGRTAQTVVVEPSRGRGSARAASHSWWPIGTIALATMFVGTPLLAVIVDGITPSLWRVLGEPTLYRAALTSLTIAAAASALAVLAALALGYGAAARAPRLFEIASLVGLVVPPVVVAAGWFLIAHRTGAASALTPVLVVLLNALMAIPYAASVLFPAIRAVIERYDRLSQSLGLTGVRRLQRIDLPLLARPVALALGLSALVSLGDLGVVAIFGGEGIVTLPLLLYQRLGSYRTDDAAALALLLTFLTLALTALLPKRDRGGDA
ncbi:MAG: ABC transporter permease subunit [Hyphomicrobiaceae bacterium]